MALDLPPPTAPAAYVAPAPECRYLTHNEAQVALQRLRRQLPSTPFDQAQPSEICGLVRVQLASGKTVYTDPTGRYLLLTFALDTHRGSPADTSEQLEQAIEERSHYPENALSGLTPPMLDEPPAGPWLTPAPQPSSP